MAETYLEKAIKRYLKIFDRAVATFFEPIAQKQGLPLVKIKNGVYEVPSPYFILRIELDFERDMGISVALRQASLRDFGHRNADSVASNRRFYFLISALFPCASKPSSSANFFTADNTFFKEARLYSTTLVRR